jgi:hypothetical protein
MMRIADVSSNVGEAVIVRAHPELAHREHDYFHDLRHSNERFNEFYQKAKSKYFDRLPAKEVSSESTEAAAAAANTAMASMTGSVVS